MEDKQKRCILCGSKRVKAFECNFTPFFIQRMFLDKKKETDMIKCSDCRFKFVEYRPSEEEMARFYTGYRDSEYQKQRQFFEPDYTEEFNNSIGHNPEEIAYRKTTMTSFISKHINPDIIKNVLDYGGDNGQFIPECFKDAEKYVYEISGVEPVEGVHNISDRNEMLKNKYDFVMCCNVLEHVSNPMELINELMQLSAKNGFVYIEVPYEGLLTDLWIAEHINRFCIKTFIKLWDILNDADFLDIAQNKSTLRVLIHNKKPNKIRKCVLKAKFRVRYFKEWIIERFYKSDITTNVKKIIDFVKFLYYVR